MRKALLIISFLSGLSFGMEAEHPAISQRQSLTFDFLKKTFPEPIQYLLIAHHKVGIQDEDFVNPAAYWDDTLHADFTYFFDPKATDRPMLTNSSIEAIRNYYGKLNDVWPTILLHKKNHTNWAALKLRELIKDFDPFAYQDERNSSKEIVMRLQCMKKDVTETEDGARGIAYVRRRIGLETQLPEALECYAFLCVLSQEVLFFSDEFLDKVEEFSKRIPNAEGKNVSNKTFATELYQALTQGDSSDSFEFKYITQKIAQHGLYMDMRENPIH